MAEIKKTMAEMLAQIASLEAALAASKVANQKALTLKIGEKGGVCLYGLGRFPVTLYPNQWFRLLDHKDNILGFIEANKDKLSMEKKAVSAPVSSVEKVG
jgi:hypothetical protein